MKTKWPIKKLGEVAEFQSGFAVAKTKGASQGVPHLRTFNVDTSGKLNLSEFIYLPENLVNKNSFGLKKGDILFNNTNSKELVGKSSIAEEDLPYAFSNHLTRIRANQEKILPGWILFVLINLWQKGYFLHHSVKWIGQAGFSAEKLKNLEIPVPGIQEQRIIIKKLEKTLAKIEEARTFGQESSEEAQNIIRTRLGELFENNSWDETRVSDIAEKPQYGYTASSAKDKIGPRLLRITDIQNGMVDWENVPYCKCNEIDRYRLTSGDIVFARTGATTGKSFLIKDTPEQTVFASYLIRLKTKGGIKQEFLYWFFQSPQYWDQIMGHQRGSAQPNVNAATLSTIKLWMPENLKEQEKIVAYLDGLSKKVQKLQTLQQEQLQELEALQQSVLHKAFQGELAR